MCYLYILLGTVVLIYLCIGVRKSAKYKFPPGPMRFPIIGNIPQLLAKNPYEKLSELAYKYGKIYTLKLGTTSAVVINEPKLIRQIFSTPQAAGRFPTDAVLCISQGPYGILGNEGQSWNEQRRFCVKNLHKLGFGKSRMESSILLEADSVCDWINERNADLNVGKNKTVLKILPIFTQSAINILWSIVTDSKIKLGDSQMYGLMKAFNDALANTVKTGLAFIPWLKYVSSDIFGYSQFDKACLDIHKLIENEFQQHKKTMTDGDSRDLIDEYIKVCGDDPVQMKHAVGSVVELFVAGFDTTGSTLTWMFYYLSRNQESQRKLQEEIDEVIGKDRGPCLKHKSKMPFAEAVILETLRMSSVAPIGSLHRLLDDLEIEDYKFPKGLMPIANLYHCHYNKNVWGDPKVFRPERFLGNEGRSLREHVIPFLVGKRQCLGESLAMDIFFIYATKLLQQFHVMLDINEQDEEYLKPDVGFLLVPQSLGLVFKPKIL